MNTTIKAVVFWLVILISAILMWRVVKSADSKTQSAPQISYSQFLSEVDEGKVAAVRISKSLAEGTYSDGRFFRVIVPASQEQMLQDLRQKNVEIWYERSDDFGWGWSALGPLAILAVLWFFMIRRVQTRANMQQARTAARGDTSFQGK